MVEDTLQKITDLAQSVLHNTGLYIVDIELKGRPGSQILSVYLESEQGGVSLDDCAKVSRELGLLLDAHEVITSKYVMQVSSPGLSRPLKDPRQFKSNIGRRAAITVELENGKKTVIRGILKDYSETALHLEDEDGVINAYEHTKVLETKILPAW